VAIFVGRTMLFFKE